MSTPHPARRPFRGALAFVFSCLCASAMAGWNTYYSGGTHTGGADGPYSVGNVSGWGGNGQNCSGTITATLTWTPDSPGQTLAPQTVYCLEQSYAVADMTSGVNGSGSADDGLGDPSATHNTYVTYVTVSQGGRLTPHDVGGSVTSFTVSASPSASVTTMQGPYTGAALAYSAAISTSASITISGATAQSDGPHAVIGQTLGFAFNGAGTGATYNWSLSGGGLPFNTPWALDPNSSGAVSSTPPPPAAYTPPSNTTANSFTCYFGHPASPETASCTVQDPNLGTIHAIAKVVIDAPPMTLSPSGESASIGNMYLLWQPSANGNYADWVPADSSDPTRFGLYGARYQGVTFGCWFPYMIGTIDGVGGKYCYVQVINSDNYTSQGVSDTDSNALDNSFPYLPPNTAGVTLGITTAMQDEPNIGTVIGVDSTGGLSIACTDTIVYQPSGGNWVPMYSWTWNASGSYQHFVAGPQWRVPSASASKTDPVQSYGTWPSWTSLATNS